MIDLLDAATFSQGHPARLYAQLPWVLSLAFVILALGGTMLYRRGAA